MTENNNENQTNDIASMHIHVSGRSYKDCVYLGQRYYKEYGSNPDDSDYWVMANTPIDENNTTTTVFFGWKNLLTSIWRSPEDVVYITNATEGVVHRYDDIFDKERPCVDYRLQTGLEGVWGLDDKNVFAWGTRRNAQDNLEWPVFLFNGKDWNELPMPGFPVMAMHGLAPDFIYAVGYYGSIRLWDGKAWKQFRSPTDEALYDVFVAGPDEIYACGQKGSILEGSAKEWGMIAEMLQNLCADCIAKFKGELYVGGGNLGLFRRVGSTSKLELFKDNLSARSFDVGEELIIACHDGIVGTVDGKSFFIANPNFLLDKYSHQPILEWEY